MALSYVGAQLSGAILGVWTAHVAMVEAAGYTPTVVDYRTTGWTRPQLDALLAAMGLRARDLLREKGTPDAELGLTDPAVSNQAIKEAMLAHPLLVNRPIVVTPKGTRICRPSEIALTLLERVRETFVQEDGEVVRP
jgi:arsenate reductase